MDLNIKPFRISWPAYALLTGIGSIGLISCSTTSPEFSLEYSTVVADRVVPASSAMVAERAFIDDQRLIIDYRESGKTLRVSAAISQQRSEDGMASSLSLYLRQAVSSVNSLPLAQLTPEDASQASTIGDGIGTVPIADITLWREFRDRLIAEITPKERGQGVVVEFLKQDEVFFYYDASGLLQSARLNDKPAGKSIASTYKFSELVANTSQVVAEYIPHEARPDSDGVLFNTGDMAQSGFPFVFISEDPSRIFFLKRPPGDETCCPESGVMLPQALVHTVDSHVTGLLKQPVASVTRLFTLVLFKVIDTLTPKPLVLLDHQPLEPVANSPPMDSVAWEQELDRLTNSRTFPGSVEYLVDGPAFFARFIDAVQAAEQSIDVRVYIFDNDHYALQIADMLKQRSSEVRVRVLIDGLGSYGAAAVSSDRALAGSERLPDIVNYLQSGSEVEVRLVENPWLTGDHSKTMVIDGETAFMGGMNLGREYRFDWHDLMVELHGPVVDEIQYQFEKAWRQQSLLGDIRSAFYARKKPLNPAKDSYIPIRVLLTRPGDSQILRTQLAAIERAQQRIYIQNAYFTSDDIIYALAKARRRGVDVRVIIPYQSDIGVINRSNVVAMNAMLANGIRVFIYPQESHIKGAIYDNWVCLGSANFDQLSLRVNKELNIATSDSRAVEGFLQHLMYPDFEKSVELTEPLPEKWSDRLLETLADQL